MRSVRPQAVGRAAAFTLLAVPAAAAPGQDAPGPPVGRGDWVRAAPRGGVVDRVTGRVVEVDSVTVVIRTGRDDIPFRLAYADLRTLQRRDGLESSGRSALRGARRGAVVGLGVGAVTTAVTALSDQDERCGGCYVSPTAAAAVLSLLFTVTTTAVGAVIGAANPRETWTAVRLPGRVGVAPPTRGSGLRVALVLTF